MLRAVRRLLCAAVLLAAVALCTSGCGALPASATESGVRVVAAENFWGSIAHQLGGTDATVNSIIVNPAQDPHSYEPTSGDARTMATAQLAIVNGIDYDRWASQLLAADPVDGRRVITVGSLLGLDDGDNSHRWYDPTDVDRVAAAISASLQRLDPKHAGHFADRLRHFERAGLARYHALIATIRHRYAGVPVGASESIFALQAPALGSAAGLTRRRVGRSLASHAAVPTGSHAHRGRGGCVCCPYRHRSLQRVAPLRAAAGGTGHPLRAGAISPPRSPSPSARGFPART